MLTDFYNIWHRVYCDTKQHRSYWFAHLTTQCCCNTFGKNLLVFPSTLDVFSGSMWAVLKKSCFQCWNEDSKVGNGPLLLEVTTIGSHSGSQGLIFHQDSVPAHTSHITQDWMQVNCPGLITRNHWTPNFPDWTITSGTSCWKSTINSR